jgi:hypothetical protein
MVTLGTAAKSGRGSVITGPPIQGGVPPLEHLGWTILGEYDGWEGELIFNGRPISTIGTMGAELIGQFRTKNGYLIFTGTPKSGNLAKFCSENRQFRDDVIYIYYVLGDFSGAEWVSMALYWWSPNIEETIHYDVGAVIRPITRFEIVNENALDFFVDGQRRFGGNSHRPFSRLYAKGWYRLFVRDDGPKRCQIGALDVNHLNTNWWMKRYLKVVRLGSSRS